MGQGFYQLLEQKAPKHCKGKNGQNQLETTSHKDQQLHRNEGAEGLEEGGWEESGVRRTKSKEEKRESQEGCHGQERELSRQRRDSHKGYKQRSGKEEKEEKEVRAQEVH